MTLPNYPSQPASVIETSGGNGYTQSLSSFLKELTGELLASGEISQAQSESLIALANQGFTFGKIQKTLEDALKTANGDEVAFLAMSLEFNGQYYNPVQLADMIGFDVTPNMINASILHSQPSGTNWNPEARKFLQFYQQAQQDGSLANPTIQAIVEKLATDIALSGEAYEHWVFNVKASGVSMENAGQNIQSDMTNYNSGGICGTGGGNVSGVECS